MEQSAVKSDRILKMYSRLVNGETLNKEKLAEAKEKAKEYLEMTLSRCTLCG